MVAERAEWADWADGIIGRWPGDPGQAEPDRQAMEETVRRADWSDT